MGMLRIFLILLLAFASSEGKPASVEPTEPAGTKQVDTDDPIVDPIQGGPVNVQQENGVDDEKANKEEGKFVNGNQNDEYVNVAENDERNVQVDEDEEDDDNDQDNGDKEDDKDNNDQDDKDATDDFMDDITDNVTDDVTDDDEK